MHSREQPPWGSGLCNQTTPPTKRTCRKCADATSLGAGAIWVESAVTISIICSIHSLCRLDLSTPCKWESWPRFSRKLSPFNRLITRTLLALGGKILEGWKSWFRKSYLLKEHNYNIYIKKTPAMYLLAYWAGYGCFIRLASVAVLGFTRGSWPRKGCPNKPPHTEKCTRVLTIKKRKKNKCR